MDKNHLKDIRFRLINYRIDQFAVFQDAVANRPEYLQHESEVRFNFLADSLILQCTSSVLFKNKDRPVATCMLTLDYELNPEDVESLKDSNDNTLILSRSLLALIASKTYGALRGALMAKLEPTTLRLLLPLSDMNRLIDSPIKVRVAKI